MYIRAMTIAVLLAVLFLASCEDTPMRTTPALAPTPIATLPPTATPLPYTGYLTEDTPPCTPITGSSVDPCEPGASVGFPELAGSIPYLGDEPQRAETALTLNDVPEFVVHIVLRGTYIPDTVRCTSGNRFQLPSYVSSDEYVGGEGEELQIMCYADVRVNDYIIGAGPPRLPVFVWFGVYCCEGELISTDAERIEQLRTYYERFLVEGEQGTSGIVGREMILFLFSSFNHAVEVWQTWGGYDVQHREDGAVIAVHPARDAWKERRPDGYREHLSVLEVELPRLERELAAAHQARVSEYGGRIGADMSLPLLITDVHDLDEFMVSTGAYDHPDGTPVPPPPVPGEGDPVPDIGVDDSTPGPTPVPPGEEPTSTPAPVP